MEVVNICHKCETRNLTSGIISYVQIFRYEHTRYPDTHNLDTHETHIQWAHHDMWVSRNLDTVLLDSLTTAKPRAEHLSAAPGRAWLIGLRGVSPRWHNTTCHEILTHAKHTQWAHREVRVPRNLDTHETRISEYLNKILNIWIQVSGLTLLGSNGDIGK
jgi:hypothetical protein